MLSQSVLSDSATSWTPGLLSCRWILYCWAIRLLPFTWYRLNFLSRSDAAGNTLRMKRVFCKSTIHDFSWGLADKKGKSISSSDHWRGFLWPLSFRATPKWGSMVTVVHSADASMLAENHLQTGLNFVFLSIVDKRTSSEAVGVGWETGGSLTGVRTIGIWASSSGNFLVPLGTICAQTCIYFHSHWSAAVCAQPNGFLGFIMSLSNFSGSSGSKGSRGRGAATRHGSVGVFFYTGSHWKLEASRSNATFSGVGRVRSSSLFFPLIEISWPCPRSERVVNKAESP